MSKVNLYVDFGTTFTKVSAIDVNNEELLGTAQACTTTDSDVSEGLNDAIQKLFRQTGEIKFKEKYACSSLDEGLKMVTIGLVPHLSVKASEEIVLGSGVKLLKTYSYKLTDEDIDEINSLDVDMILLCGGTDAGNKDNVIYNSKKITLIDKNIPLIYAGNKEAAFECRKILEKSFSDIRIVENIMPEHRVLNTDPLRKTIKEVFVERIIKLEQFSKVQRELTGIIMPTSSSIFNAARILSQGINDKQSGELMVVDSGGSTTEVYSLAKGNPSKEDISIEGFIEPYEKRTVEENLGLRYSVNSLAEVCGIDKIKKELKKLDQPFKEIQEHLVILRNNPTFIPVKEEHTKADAALCKFAVDTAVRRHAGFLTHKNTQKGKDLTNIKYVVGTGGPIVHGDDSEYILSGAVFKPRQSHILKPKTPKFLIDKEYIMYSLGMLSETDPDKAKRMINKYILEL